jgi:hypothetical protein
VNESEIDPTNPMFKPITIKEALEITGRTRRTLERWVADGQLTKYERANRRTTVVLFNEDDVTRIEKERSDAQFANRERIRQRGGRPGPRTPPAATAT